jgi:hypothetical protein
MYVCARASVCVCVCVCVCLCKTVLDKLGVIYVREIGRE